MTYKQAYNLIIEAYFKDEIDPYIGSFCFCGTLAYADSAWQSLSKKETINGYSSIEFFRMERELLSTIKSETVGGKIKGLGIYAIGKTGNYELRGEIKSHSNYEAALFNGMSKALDVLKQIHELRGEIIDEPIETFKKRKLSQV